jgi:hypothetical protein
MPRLVFDTDPAEEPSSERDDDDADANNPTEDSASSKPPPLPSKKPRPSCGSYQSFDGEEYAAVKAVVLEHLAVNGDVAAATKAVGKSHPTIVVKRQTANSWLKKLQKEAVAKTNNDDSDQKLASFDRHAKAKTDLINNKSSLTSNADREFLQSVIKTRDERNAGMTRKEVICVIAEIGSVPFKAAENHLDYLIRSKKLPELKNSGRIVSAQATTTNRTAITTEKLLRTHTSQEEGELRTGCFMFYYYFSTHQYLTRILHFAPSLSFTLMCTKFIRKVSSINGQ